MDKANKKIETISENVSNRWDNVKQKFNRGVEVTRAKFENAAASTLEWTAAPIQRRAEQIANIGALVSERGAGKLERRADRKEDKAESMNYVTQGDKQIANMEAQIAFLQEQISARKEQLEDGMVDLMDQCDEDRAGAESLRNLAEKKREVNAEKYSGAQKAISALRERAGERLAA